jgi:hypothetical protein
MKVQFDSTELAWVQDTLARLLVTLHKDGQKEIVGQLSRLRYKFTPNASYVNLKAKEIAFLEHLIRFRYDNFNWLAAMGSEAATLRSIRSKLEERAS